MRFLIFLSVLSFGACQCPPYQSNYSTPKLIESHGFPCETHKFPTKDGYILTMHRIPPGENRTNNYSVLLQHGLFQSSLNWVILGPDNSLAFLLAKLGYDVWLGNFRGNCYSREHTNLTANDTKYWEFSHDEHGLYDLPAEIDYMLNVAACIKIILIGHSMGTTSLIAGASQKPEINQKILAVMMLAPICFLGNCTSVSLRTTSFAGPFATLATGITGNFEVCPTNRITNDTQMTACKLLPDACSQTLGFCGNTFMKYNKTAVPLVLSNLCSTSSKQILHYSQYMDYFNCGPYYKGPLNGTSIRPTDYNFSQVTTKIYLYYSTGDQCGNRMDVKRLKKELPNVKDRFLNYTADHMCFTLCVDTKEKVNDPVIKDVEAERLADQMANNR